MKVNWGNWGWLGFKNWAGTDLFRMGLSAEPDYMTSEWSSDSLQMSWVSRRSSELQVGFPWVMSLTGSRAAGEAG